MIARHSFPREIAPQRAVCLPCDQSTFSCTALSRACLSVSLSRWLSPLELLLAMATTLSGSLYFLTLAYWCSVSHHAAVRGVYLVVDEPDPRRMLAAVPDCRRDELRDIDLKQRRCRDHMQSNRRLLNSKAHSFTLFFSVQNAPHLQRSKVPNTAASTVILEGTSVVLVTRQGMM